MVQNSQHFICSQFCGPEVRARLGWMGLLSHVASAGIPPEVVVRWWLGLECPRRFHHRSGTLVVMTGISLFLSLPCSQFMQGCLRDLSSASLHGSWVLIVSIVRGKARSCIKYMASLLGHSISPSKIYGDPRSTGSVNRLHTLAGEWQRAHHKKAWAWRVLLLPSLETQFNHDVTQQFLLYRSLYLLIRPLLPCLTVFLTWSNPSINPLNAGI